MHAVLRFRELRSAGARGRGGRVLEPDLLFAAYCLYYGVPPVFFGAGHLAKVCPGLEAHAAEHIYRGRPPRVLDLDAPLGMIEDMDLEGWVDEIRRAYETAPSPAAALAAIRAAA